MFRLIRNLVHETRHQLLLGFNRLIHRSNRTFSSNRKCSSSKLRSGDLFIGQLYSENLEESSCVGPQEIKTFYANGNGDMRVLPAQTRTRGAWNRTQVLNMSSIHLMVCQVVNLLKQIGLDLRVIAEDRLTATWPTETNLDCLERQDPLIVELQISSEKRVKFRKISGPESLFRTKTHDVLKLIYDNCGF